MTDLEMLQQCLDAFRALKKADAANNFLKIRNPNKKYQAWSGTGQYKLRVFMISELEKHITKRAKFDPVADAHLIATGHLPEDF